ncbi:hypothetical protein AB8A31_10010 [Tardiphaga sp. 804_B3_N1_9]|uniref:hypothetical protein n=1 Tax=Tardiphaga TaxID=1395974 RepID=UPI001586BD6F|nr:hypothetical protein [Tardiphaga robiniae]NUU39921.1 hypothetical protein [Tardiphaga robiniae]
MADSATTNQGRQNKALLISPLKSSICSEAAERGTDCAGNQKMQMRRKLELAMIAIYGAALLAGISAEAIASIAK